MCTNWLLNRINYNTNYEITDNRTGNSFFMSRLQKGVTGLIVYGESQTVVLWLLLSCCRITCVILLPVANAPVLLPLF